MTWLALAFALEIGTLPSGGFVLYEAPDFINAKGSYYIDFQAEIVAWDLLYISGGIKTYIWDQGGEWTFWPHSTLYNVGAGLRLGLLTVGWRHFCAHPVTPYSILYDPQLQGEGSWDEIFVRMEGKIGGKK
jgi:hypothetical protein